MYARGVVAVLLAAGLCAAESHKEPSTQDLLEELFSGIESVSDYSHYRFIDLEELLEAWPEIQDEFKALSDEDKESLVQAFDEFNEALAKAFQDESSL